MAAAPRCVAHFVAARFLQPDRGKIAGFFVSRGEGGGSKDREDLEGDVEKFCLVSFSLSGLSLCSIIVRLGREKSTGERTRKKKLRGYFKMNSFGEFCYIVCANKRQRLK